MSFETLQIESLTISGQPWYLELATNLVGSRFPITLEKDEDDFVIASCPVLPGCHSQGRTEEEAVANIREAVRGYVASLRKHGEPIPFAAFDRASEEMLTNFE